jgi:DNA-binding NtrC family response regulator
VRNLFRDLNLNGAVERALGGTLCISGISDLSRSMQEELLKLVGRDEKTGSNEGRAAECPRIIATASSDIADLVLRGRFLGELHERLSATHIALPPLWRRPQDIPLIAQQILVLSHPEKTLNQDACDELNKYHWPGNIPELRTVIDEAASNCEDREVNAANVLEYVGRHGTPFYETSSLWARRVFDKEATYADLKREFVRTSSIMNSVLVQLIGMIKAAQGSRPSEKDLCPYLDIEPNNIAQLLNVNGIRLRDFD